MLVSHSLVCAFSVLLMVYGGDVLLYRFDVPLDSSDSSELAICQDQCMIVDTLGACTLSNVNCLCSSDNGKAYAELMNCLVGASKEGIRETAQTVADHEY
ncbi:hypothetical protein DFS33DRAFT_1384701 [Desarmillaria ectypa]|nr:hypothetical protein DFS33DRAFT_1384701 [Desarmillaria ectypa]